MLVLAGHDPVLAQPPAPPEVLARGIRQVENGDLEAAVATLELFLRSAPPQAATPQDRARAHLYLALAHLGLAQTALAEGAVREAVRIDPELRPDPLRFPPKIVETWEQARASSQGAPPSPPATSPLPAPAGGPSRPAKPARVERFAKVKLIVNKGDKAEEKEAVLVLDEEALTLRAREGPVLRRIPYAEIRSLEYSYSKYARWKSGAVGAVLVGVLAAPLFFMKGKKHWLTVVDGGGFALVRLDKDNYQVILPAVEARTGRKIEYVPGE
jgi:hypothetical protein